MSIRKKLSRPGLDTKIRRWAAIKIRTGSRSQYLRIVLEILR